MNRLKKGYVQIFTGNGKGKTTAALGQALRAAGSGLTTFIVMFMKDFAYGEIKSIKHLSDWIRLEQYGNDAFVFRKQSPDNEDKKAARLALKRTREAMLCAKYDMVIMDEICVAIHFGLLKTEDVLSLLDEKPEPIELILTGRYCPPELIEKADLVTEMQEIKHYYQKGVAARKGIES
ncbi:MAG: cob(I)yrinic acid a,c-diamide adenosyltransferase [Desulfobacterales bacterium]|jgi:cob(I)alamin adenosyltransferase